MKEIKLIRNKLLSETDWTQLPDVALSDSEKQAWALYRQELRDLFTTNVPSYFEGNSNFWPTPPERFNYVDGDPAQTPANMLVDTVDPTSVGNIKEMENI